MAVQHVINPNHKAIKTYHGNLARFGEQSQQEGSVSMAFLGLLDATAKARNWTAVHQQEIKIGGKTLKPDATLRDQWKLPHGYWEAKDTHDDLDQEIQKKFAAGYPRTNIIFEDTRHGVLIQNGEEVTGPT